MCCHGCSCNRYDARKKADDMLQQRKVEVLREADKFDQISRFLHYYQRYQEHIKSLSVSGCGLRGLEHIVWVWSQISEVHWVGVISDIRCTLGGCGLGCGLKISGAHWVGVISDIRSTLGGCGLRYQEHIGWVWSQISVSDIRDTLGGCGLISPGAQTLSEFTSH